MALVYKDRVKETTTTTGTGTITLAGAVTGYQAFSVIGDGNTCIYVIEDANGTGWEVGVGTYTLSGTTLARTTVLASSNSGSAITLSSGTHDVYVSADARGLAQGALPIKAETVTTANVTAVANTHHVCTITGLTADRNFVLPTPTAIGDRIRVTVTDGDDTYELVLIGDTGVKINGGTAATEWSRLFIANESVQFVATAADNWTVEIDKRLPCSFSVYMDADMTSKAGGAVHQLEYDTENYDIGSVFDTTASVWAFKPRRNAPWILANIVKFEAVADGFRIVSNVEEDTATIIQDVQYLGATSATSAVAAVGTWVVSNASTYTFEGRHDDSSSRTIAGESNGSLVTGLEAL